MRDPRDTNDPSALMVAVALMVILGAATAAWTVIMVVLSLLIVHVRQIA